MRRLAAVKLGFRPVDMISNIKLMLEIMSTGLKPSFSDGKRRAALFNAREDQF